MQLDEEQAGAEPWRWWRLAAGAALPVAIGVGFLWATRSRLVVVALPPWKSFIHEPPSSTMRNPFGDPEPERIAQGFLDRLKLNPAVLHSLYLNSEERNRLIEGETEAPLITWTLVQGKVRGSEAQLSFVLTRQRIKATGTDPGKYSLLGAVVLKRGNGGWQVTGYGAAY